MLPELGCCLGRGLLLSRRYLHDRLLTKLGFSLKGRAGSPLWRRQGLKMERSKGVQVRL